MKKQEVISIHKYKVKKLKNYYGASKKVYRKSHVENLLKMWASLHYLSELYTRTRLVPCNMDFLIKKAIPAYNETLQALQAKYPNIKEFQNYKKASVTEVKTIKSK